MNAHIRVGRRALAALSVPVNGGGPELGDLLSMGLTLATVRGRRVRSGLACSTIPFDTFPGVRARRASLLGIVAASVYFYKTFKRYS